MLLSNEAWLTFYGHMKKRTGLDLNLYKPEQMRRRIASMMEAKGAKNLEEFWKVVGSSDHEVRWFMDKLAINVSELFRNPEKWTEMRDRVLPELSRKTRNLKCWSAGCSFGAEAHTLATLLDAHFPGNHSILGTDIDAAALAQANRGEFVEADMRGVPAEYRSRYYERTDTGWKAKPSLRKYLTFRHGDLLSDRFDSGYDLIMCRNVVIYFTEPAKDDLYRKFFQALKPGGILFVGSTERIFNARQMGYESPIPFFYQKPSTGDTQWRNAS